MRICSVDGCGARHKAKGYCRRHWRQLREKGRLLEYGKSDPNQIIIDGNDAIIVLRDKFGNEKGRAVIGIRDLDLIKGYKWGMNNNGYATTTINGKTICMHRLILGIFNDKQVDHKNGKRLDNHRNNIRECNPAQNAMNQGMYKNNKSGVTGVVWHKQHKKWLAQLELGGKNYHLGYFESFSDAVKARREGEQKYFGEFARVN